jgi:hypothetical protein
MMYIPVHDGNPIQVQECGGSSNRGGIEDTESKVAGGSCMVSGGSDESKHGGAIPCSPDALDAGSGSVQGDFKGVAGDIGVRIQVPALVFREGGSCFPDHIDITRRMDPQEVLRICHHRRHDRSACRNTGKGMYQTFLSFRMSPAVMQPEEIP